MYPDDSILWGMFLGDSCFIFWRRVIGLALDVFIRLKQMSTSPQHSRNDSIRWRRWALIGFTLLAWLIIMGIVFWGIGQIGGALTILIFSLLVAYIIYPVVRLLERFLPRFAAVVIAYVGVLGLILFLFYYVILTSFFQLLLAAQQLQQEIPVWLENLKPLAARFGLTPENIQASSSWIFDQILRFVGNLQPFLFNIFGILLTFVLIITLSVYFVLDGRRVLRWLRERSPTRIRSHMVFVLDTLDHTMGGFIRGQLFLGTLMSVILGIGLTIIGIPYALLLTVIVFICEFIPQIGAYISATIIIFIALVTKGWQVGLVVLVFCTFVNAILEGQILAPRIIGQSVGLHPILSIAALIIAAQLFGLIGALLAAPVVGMLQIFIMAFWHSWQQRHPEQFSVTDEEQDVHNGDSAS